MTGATGPTGSAVEADFLSAYSVPAALGTAGTALIFDRNGTSQGTSISHVQGSGEFTLNDSGLYVVAFHSTLAPASGVTFPLNILLYLQQDGNSVSGAGVQHTFHTSAESANVAFSVPISAATTPSTLEVVSQDGNFLYSGLGMSIYKIG